MEELELSHKQQGECVIKMMELCDQGDAQEIALLTSIPGKPQSAMTILNDLSAFKPLPILSLAAGQTHQYKGMGGTSSYYSYAVSW